MSVTVFTYPSDFKPDMLVEGIQQHFESHGFNSARMIGGSKSVYKSSKPKDLVIFNANVFMKDSFFFFCFIFLRFIFFLIVRMVLVVFCFHNILYYNNCKLKLFYFPVIQLG